MTDQTYCADCAQPLTSRGECRNFQCRNFRFPRVRQRTYVYDTGEAEMNAQNREQAERERS